MNLLDVTNLTCWYWTPFSCTIAESSTILKCNNICTKFVQSNLPNQLDIKIWTNCIISFLFLQNCATSNFNLQTIAIFVQSYSLHQSIPDICHGRHGQHLRATFFCLCKNNDKYQVFTIPDISRWRHLRHQCKNFQVRGIFPYWPLCNFVLSV